MEIKLVEENGILKVITPYDPAFVTELKERLPYESRTWNKPSWDISIENKDIVLDILKEVFGYTEGDIYLTLKITAKEKIWGDKGSAKCGVISIAQAWGRDSGAKVCSDVVLLEGHINSGGSMKNWGTKIVEGSSFRVSNFPKGALDTIDNDEWDYEILDDKEEKKKRLEKERSILLEKLSNIEKELESLE